MLKRRRSPVGRPSRSRKELALALSLWYALGWTDSQTRSQEESLWRATPCSGHAYYSERVEGGQEEKRDRVWEVLGKQKRRS